MAKKKPAGKWYDLDGDYLDELREQYLRCQHRLAAKGLSEQEKHDLGIQLARIENRRLAAKGFAVDVFRM